MLAMTKPMGAALLASCLFGIASAQVIDPGSNRLPPFPNDVCGTGSEGRGAAAYFAAGSSSGLAEMSERLLRHILEGVQRDGGWVLLTGHVDAAEVDQAGRLDLQRAEFVRDWLVAQGARPERIWLRGRGAHDPMVVAVGAAPENRRVDFLLTQHGAACSHRLRSGIHSWFRQNCFPTLRADDTADCDEALRLLR